MEVKVYVDAKTAIMYGKVKYGELTVKIDEEFLEKLTLEERKELSEVVSNRNCIGRGIYLKGIVNYRGDSLDKLYPDYEITEPTQDELFKALSHRVVLRQLAPLDLEEAKRQYEKEEKQRNEEEHQRLLTCNIKEFFPYNDPELNQFLFNKVPERHQEILDYQKELQSKKDEKIRLEKEKEEKIKKEKEQYKTALQTWIEDKAIRMDDMILRKRAEEKLVSEIEILGLLRDELFASLNDFTRFKKLNSSSIDHEDNCSAEYHGKPIRFSTYETESLTKEEYIILEAIRKKAPSNVKIELKTHEVKCSDCDKCEITNSVLITLTWNGKELSREYTLS